MKKIEDEFSDLPVSRQRKYQLRRMKEGRCRVCGAETEKGTLCEKHRQWHREYQNQRRQGANPSDLPNEESE